VCGLGEIQPSSSLFPLKQKPQSGPGLRLQESRLVQLQYHSQDQNVSGGRTLTLEECGDTAGCCQEYSAP
jgi:hypothetical protein